MWGKHLVIAAQAIAMGRYSPSPVSPKNTVGSKESGKTSLKTYVVDAADIAKLIPKLQ